MNNRIIEKLTSGRFLLTIIGGGVFAYSVITKQLEAATITAILMMIFQAYFQKGDRGSNGSAGQDKNKL